jgi:serine protease inhibitor
VSNLYVTYNGLNCTQVVFGANDKNTVISPVSVSTLLALLQQGSGGNTEVQLTQVLHLNPQQSRQGYSQLTRNLKVKLWTT